MSVTLGQLAGFAIAWFMRGPVIDVDEDGTLHASKRGDREIVLTRRLAASGQAVFDALTQPREILRWMKPTHMSLLTCEVDLRPGGSLLYVFQRKRATVLRQTLRYASQYDLDQDFDGAATSAAEVYEKLARYLETASTPVR